ncbi:MAG: hypothetical protein WKF66_09935 [Pedobacter sp.]
MKSIIQQLTPNNKELDKSQVAAIHTKMNSPSINKNRNNFLKKVAIGGIVLGGSLSLLVENTIAQTISKVSETTVQADIRITDLNDAMEEPIRQYTYAWNQESPAAIKEALVKCWSATSTYIDPRTPLAVGIDQLVEVIYKSYKRSPGRKFRLVSKADCHHGSGRFKWELILANKEVIEGTDYFEYNEKKQITRIVGFFGALL